MTTFEKIFKEEAVKLSEDIAKRLQHKYVLTRPSKACLIEENGQFGSSVCTAMRFPLIR